MSEGFISKLKSSAFTVVFRSHQGISNIELQLDLTLTSEVNERKKASFKTYQNAQVTAQLEHRHVQSKYA